MTVHRPTAERNFAEADTPFHQLERALLLSVLAEETSRWCRQCAALRPPNYDDPDELML
ncbi:hypothetical protein [Alicyclobacillus acidoterrestris]|uniref:Uncharacterized protein n=1 Tax=Alicyclobacillus acidoterrestris (strain ATCC 49025 / DSM 3922 / CIP 106132 / NCIMB 13137 / GD3B) TaxID=1356854 RepID=T0D273_ALIAG|nr:hypothetical protein [Alicyclobacillus acidoterrestris]EPZ45667.1 hypothetical protein N007_08465 [Alicyclobacillus acidoterrestris ATCC 49025]UNO47340.1 hypothetical protein K1I37_11430 [Alicyclobacillus acidoterrestris]